MRPTGAGAAVIPSGPVQGRAHGLGQAGHDERSTGGGAGGYGHEHDMPLGNRHMAGGRQVSRSVASEFIALRRRARDPDRESGLLKGGYGPSGEGGVSSFMSVAAGGSMDRTRPGSYQDQGTHGCPLDEDSWGRGPGADHILHGNGAGARASSRVRGRLEFESEHQAEAMRVDPKALAQDA